MPLCCHCCPPERSTAPPPSVTCPLKKQQRVPCPLYTCCSYQAPKRGRRHHPNDGRGRKAANCRLSPLALSPRKGVCRFAVEIQLQPVSTRLGGTACALSSFRETLGQHSRTHQPPPASPGQARAPPVMPAEIGKSISGKTNPEQY